MGNVVLKKAPGGLSGIEKVPWVGRQKSQQVGALAQSLISRVTSGTVSFPVVWARDPRLKMVGGVT